MGRASGRTTAIAISQFSVIGERRGATGPPLRLDAAQPTAADRQGARRLCATIRSGELQTGLDALLTNRASVHLQRPLALDVLSTMAAELGERYFSTCLARTESFCSQSGLLNGALARSGYERFETALRGHYCSELCLGLVRLLDDTPSAQADALPMLSTQPALIASAAALALAPLLKASGEPAIKALLSSGASDGLYHHVCEHATGDGQLLQLSERLSTRNWVELIESHFHFPDREDIADSVMRMIDRTPHPNPRARLRTPR